MSANVINVGGNACTVFSLGVVFNGSDCILLHNNIIKEKMVMFFTFKKTSSISK